MTPASHDGLSLGSSDELLPPPQEWPASYTAVTVPAHPDFVASIRAMARATAVLADLSLDDVEELQIAVDEAAALLLPLADASGRWLRARFEVESGRLVTKLDMSCRAGRGVDRSGLAWMMLTAIDPGVVVTEDGGTVTITIVRGHGSSVP